MLTEAAVVDPVADTNRPLKRRRVVREVSIPSQESSRNHNDRKPASSPVANDEQKAGQVINIAGSARKGVQTVEASSDESDESDFGFEDVDLDQPAATNQAPVEEDGIADVSISLDAHATPKRKAQARRKPASFAEKAHRLHVHKAHVLCLLGHCIYVNSWCNNEVVQRNLEPLLTERITKWLNLKTSDSQFVRNRSFMDGMQQVSEMFRDHFRVTASGMRKAQWATEDEGSPGQTDVEPMDRSDFIRAAKKLEGSQDTGNQLFCAMLRSIGVEARLVCSLQPLPATSTVAKTTTPQKAVKPTVFAIASDTDPDKSEASADDSSVQSSRSIGKVPSVRRRLGQPSFAASPFSAPPPKEKKKPIRKLSYPVFWVEAFNAAQQKWIPVDPVVTGTVNKPSKLEPPSSYEFNQLAYVIAFESDGVARDVTRRYAKAYNAKTRRQRVEATEGGTLWWRKALRIFRRRDGVLDRDQLEDAELAQKEMREGLPSNVQDFKDHPYYALERHCKRHEVIHPRREVGKVNAGTAAKPRMEAVFRRQDVLICRSAEKWYRLGREVKAGEQPLKHVAARNPRRLKSPMDDDEGGEASANTTALYAPYQTDLYVPPPVIHGRIPRNVYGNLDIYTASMVPGGGMHMRHPLTQQAARLISVDYADAVTGFQFKGRQGTAVIEGAVVAERYADAIRAVIDGFEHEREMEMARARSLLALRLWKRFLTGLRIAERVSGYADPAARAKAAKEARARMEGAGDEDDGVREAGGLFSGGVGDEEALPTAGRFTIEELIAPARAPARKKRRVEESGEEEEEIIDQGAYGHPDEEYGGGGDEDGGGGFVREDGQDDGDGGGFLAAEDDAVEQEDDDGGGGFVPDGEGGGGFLSDEAAFADDGGGGFMPEDEDQGIDGEIGPAVNHLQQEESGGGFLPDGSDMDMDVTPVNMSGHKGNDNSALRRRDDGSNVASASHAHSSDITAGPSAVPTVDEGVANIDTVVEARLGDQIADSLQNAGGGDRAIPGPTAQGWDDHAEADVGLEHEEADGGSEVAQDESDRGSLLSHDPEDEDAEPDWLESD